MFFVCCLVVCGFWFNCFVYSCFVWWFVLFVFVDWLWLMTFVTFDLCVSCLLFGCLLLLFVSYVSSVCLGFDCYLVWGLVFLYYLLAGYFLWLVGFILRLIGLCLVVEDGLRLDVFLVEFDLGMF